MASRQLARHLLDGIFPWCSPSIDFPEGADHLILHYETTLYELYFMKETLWAFPIVMQSDHSRQSCIDAPSYVIAAQRAVLLWDIMTEDEAPLYDAGTFDLMDVDQPEPCQ